jgi:ferrous iron transport protein B
MSKKIILVGNPNVGKSMLFNRLTGEYAVVSNYPGTTVDISKGASYISGEKWEVIDTPGTISLLPDSEDEQVTRDILFSESDYVIVQVADEKNIFRTLLLTFELVEFCVPMVLVLNMSDEAKAEGIRVDAEKLEKALGIGVVETVATAGTGIKELKKKIQNARMTDFSIGNPPQFEEFVKSVAGLLDIRARYAGIAARMLLSGDQSVLAYFDTAKSAGVKEKLSSYLGSIKANPRHVYIDFASHRAGQIAGEVVSASEGKNSDLLLKLGNLSMRPFAGYLIVAVVLFVMYEFVGVFGAGVLVDLCAKIFNNYINPLFVLLFDKIPVPHIVKSFFIGPFGVITMALTYAFSIVLPIVATFFVFFGVLEDSGYLPRLSAMLDRVFSVFGLNGKAVIPMVLGLGCGTMASLTTRILETRKERLLVIVLLAVAVPCSAQLGVTLGLLAGLSIMAFVIWFLSIIISLLLVGWAAEKLIPGCRQPFLLEIPPLRIPNMGNIFQKVRMRLMWYLKEAVPLFVLGTAILFFMDITGLLSLSERVLKPFISTGLGLPAETTSSFIMGFLRRDYGSAMLYNMAKHGLLTPRQVVVSVVTITLFIPCIAQFFVVVKEHGIKLALVILAFVMAYAFLFGGALNLLLKTTNLI